MMVGTAVEYVRVMDLFQQYHLLTITIIISIIGLCLVFVLVVDGRNFVEEVSMHSQSLDLPVEHCDEQEEQMCNCPH